MVTPVLPGPRQLRRELCAVNLWAPTVEKMKKSRLTEKICEKLKEEAREWEILAREESPDEVAKSLENAEMFKVLRPPRQPISVRLDPRDVSLLKRFARRQGVTYSQLIAQWLHERLREEKSKY